MFAAIPLCPSVFRILHCLFIQDFVNLKVTQLLIALTTRFSQSEVLLLSNIPRYRKIQRTRSITFLRIVGEYRPRSFKLNSNTYFFFLINRTEHTHSESKHCFQDISILYIILSNGWNFTPIFFQNHSLADLLCTVKESTELWNILQLFVLPNVSLCSQTSLK